MSSFHAMSTSVEVLTPGLEAEAEETAARSVAVLFAETEQRFSRFRPDSELSRLNRSAGEVRVSASMLAALLRARAYVRLTGGLFDPTVGAALDAIGYDRSFGPAGLDRPAVSACPAPSRFEQVVIDDAAGTVAVPAGVRLDFGGFIKGHTVDRAARILPGTAAIDAGGDVVLRGAGPAGEGWLVDVEDPEDPARVVLTFRARDVAVATSAPNRRRWRAGGREQHHLIDPRTSRPGGSDLAQATVIARTAELAEVLAKTAFLLGAAEGRRFLERLPGVAAVLVRRDRGVEIVGVVEVTSDERD
jgi:thiamine biosynthesis lipoprotein